ncbi:MAG: protein-export chaperone SecB [Opitutales bacterium]|nr:protein-export chaperone SecB [Opitutales bacterium]MCH8539805.1 protein-export chaperone SecB [Opitutales bacterium]
MIPSLFQLLDYWVDFIQVKANPQYDSQNDPQMDFDSIQVNHDVQRFPPPKDMPEENGSLWSVEIQIEQELKTGKNIPYTFSLEMRGIIAVHPSIEKDKLDQQIQVNGPTLLFGAAREIIRAATGRGKFGPVVIPSTRFMGKASDSPTDNKRSAISKKQATKKTRTAKGKN